MRLRAKAVLKNDRKQCSYRQADKAKRQPFWLGYIRYESKVVATRRSVFLFLTENSLASSVWHSQITTEIRPGSCYGCLRIRLSVVGAENFDDFWKISNDRPIVCRSNERRRTRTSERIAAIVSIQRGTPCAYCIQDWTTVILYFFFFF